MRATTAFVRLLVRGLAWDAEDAGVSFPESLKIAARGKLAESQKGKVLIGTSSAKTAVTFSLPPLGTLNAEDVAEACSVLLDRCDEIVAASPNITDTELLAALLADLRPVRSVGSNFQGLRA